MPDSLHGVIDKIDSDDVSLRILIGSLNRNVVEAAKTGSVESVIDLIRKFVVSTFGNDYKILFEIDDTFGNDTSVVSFTRCVNESYPNLAHILIALRKGVWDSDVVGAMMFSHSHYHKLVLSSLHFLNSKTMVVETSLKP